MPTGVHTQDRVPDKDVGEELADPAYIEEDGDGGRMAQQILEMRVAAGDGLGPADKVKECAIGIGASW